MNSKLCTQNRRQLLKSALALYASTYLTQSNSILAATPEKIEKGIPSTGESLPVIGLGTSRTFDVSDKNRQLELLPVFKAFFEQGGSLVDSSPMYGAAEEVIGVLLKALPHNPTLFSATKVWTVGEEEGVNQMLKSMAYWGRNKIDLMQIHNLKDWKTHLKTLRDWKEQGKVRYIGITTSHNRFHEELSEIMRKEPLDFVQFSYNIQNRTSEKSLMPIAFDRGIAVIVNRAFQRGELFRKVKGRKVPEWASEFGIESWGQFFLKYVVSHPVVTCVIPATTKVKHINDNMQAGYGLLPDALMREKMADYMDRI